MDADEAEKDSGLQCLILVALHYEVPADPGQLRHEFGPGDGAFGDQDLLRAARWLGLKARVIAADWDTLTHVHDPCIARLKDDRFVLVNGVAGNAVLLREPHAASHKRVARAEFERTWTGTILLCARRARLAAPQSPFAFASFVPFIVKYKRYLRAVLIASVCLQLVALITPLFFQVVVDRVLVHRSLATLDVLAIGFLVVTVFEVVLGGLRTVVLAQTTNRIDAVLGADLFAHLLRLPVSYFLQRRVGDTVARVRELETLRNFVTGSSITLVVDLLFTVVFFAVLYRYSPRLTLFVAATLPLYTALALTVTPALRARLRERFNRGTETQAYLVESVSGIETLRACALESTTQRRWEERLAAHVSASFDVTHLSSIANQSAALINKVMVVGILWLGARLVIEGALTVGQLVAFNMIAGRIASPILGLVRLWHEFQQAGLSVRRIGDILNAETEPVHSTSRGSLPALEGGVTFDHVTFRYAPQRPEVLREISFDVRPGEVIGIVGRSGSGKSTLTKLIQRLHVPESGRVLVDGVDLAMVDTAWLRRRIGVVLQENVLFNRTVAENIALSDPTLCPDSVERASKLAGAHDFILELARGYDTVVGERGSNLSGGQRQRIAIARALVTDPEILIFDEATSALDHESETLIRHNMSEICKGRTVFIIAHRLSSVRFANRILVLERGRIVEAGGHTELVERDGHYARLYRAQSATLAV